MKLRKHTKLIFKWFSLVCKFSYIGKSYRQFTKSTDLLKSNKSSNSVKPDKSCDSSKFGNQVIQSSLITQWFSSPSQVSQTVNIFLENYGEQIFQVPQYPFYREIKR